MVMAKEEACVVGGGLLRLGIGCINQHKAHTWSRWSAWCTTAQHQLPIETFLDDSVQRPWVSARPVSGSTGKKRAK